MNASSRIVFTDAAESANRAEHYPRQRQRRRRAARNDARVEAHKRREALNHQFDQSEHFRSGPIAEAARRRLMDQGREP